MQQQPNQLLQQLQQFQQFQQLLAAPNAQPAPQTSPDLLQQLQQLLAAPHAQPTPKSSPVVATSRMPSHLIFGSRYSGDKEEEKSKIRALATKTKETQKENKREAQRNSSLRYPAAPLPALQQVNKKQTHLIVEVCAKAVRIPTTHELEYRRQYLTMGAEFNPDEEAFFIMEVNIFDLINFFVIICYK